MTTQGHNVINYIDDIIGFGTVFTANTSFCTLQALLQKLGFNISIKKLVQPAKSSISRKLSNILEMCQNWSKKSHCTKKQLQSLLGCLLYPLGRVSVIQCSFFRVFEMQGCFY